MPEHPKTIRKSKCFIVLTFLLASVFVVAQPTIGNKTEAVATPNGTDKHTFSHTQNTGSDGLVIVVTQSPNNNVSSVTYGGQSMTVQCNFLKHSWRTRIWVLTNPPTGSNDVVVNYSANQWAARGHFAISFTGASGVGTPGWNSNGGWETTRTRNTTVDADSRILGFGITSGSGSVSHNFSNSTWHAALPSRRSFGGVSDAKSAGTYGFTSTPSGTHAYPMAIEIKAAAASCSVGSASSSPSVAQNSAMTNITHATSGVTGVTSSSGLPTGVSASYSSDVLTISGTPSETGTFNYTIDVDGCDDDATGTITVTSCAGTASSSPSVAVNTAMTNITYTTSAVSGITSSSGLPSGVTASYSSNTLTISGTPTATGTFNYTIDLTGCGDDATGTITVFAPPGGVSDDLHLWLKADAQTFSDAGSTASTDGTEVQEWHDQSGNSFDATDNGGTGPDWDEDALNFNPGIDFVSASSEDLEIANGITESENKASLFHYYVLKVDVDQDNGFFREDLASSRYYEALHWANENFFGNYGNATDGEGRIVSNWGANYGDWHLWGWGTSNSVLTPTSTRRYLMRDNTVIDSDNSNTNVGGTGNSSTFYLGSRNAGDYLDGTLCELIIYDGVPTETEEDQIQTYLAVKYGITLAGEDYTHSDGSTVIWDYSSYSAYHNGIAGIGRDDNSGLHQKQSKSTNYGTVLTMSTEAIAATNAANGTSLTNGTYLLWGHNNSSSSGYADLPTGSLVSV